MICHAMVSVVIMLPQQTDTFEYYVTEHFRLSGVYWGLTGMAALGKLGDMDEAGIVSWVTTCQVSHDIIRITVQVKPASRTLVNNCVGARIDGTGSVRPKPRV